MADPKTETTQRASGVFAATHWSVVLLAGGGEAEEADTALENLCRAYCQRSLEEQCVRRGGEIQ